jgi:hypothetical protein
MCDYVTFEAYNFRIFFVMVYGGPLASVWGKLHSLWGQILKMGSAGFCEKFIRIC